VRLELWALLWWPLLPVSLYVVLELRRLRGR
jgi:hypothetical protein